MNSKGEMSIVKENSKIQNFSQMYSGRYIPKRYILTALGFVGFCISHTLRYNLSVAMVAMVNHTRSELGTNESSISEECSNDLYFSNSSSETKTYQGERYNWSAKTQGYILSAFFYCYFITVFTGGFLSQRYGAKRIFGGGLFLTAILTLLTPVVVRWGTVPFIVLRALEGIGEGMTCPSINVLIGNWAPKNERSRISSAIFSGAAIGSFLCLTVTGWLCTLDFLGGWPSAFYVTGTLGCIWYIFWQIFIFETPEKHPGISKEELSLYLEDKEAAINHKLHSKVIWKKIALSLPMWAVIIAQCGVFFCSNLIQSEIPLYLSKVQRFDVSTIGLIVGISHIFEWIGAVIASILADKLISSGTFRRTIVRKLVNSFAFAGTSIGLIGISLSGCDSFAAVALFIFSMWIEGSRYSGFNVMHVEMCPQLAGSLYGIANGIACLFGIVGPIMTGYFTQSGDTLRNWSYVLYVGAAVYLGTGLFFVIFASAERQSWLVEDDKNSERKSSAITEDRDPHSLNSLQSFNT